MREKISGQEINQGSWITDRSGKSKTIYWLALSQILRGDYRRLEKVARAFPDIEKAFEAGEMELLALGLEKEIVDKFVSGMALELAHKLEARLIKNNFWVISKDDPDYPSLLREIHYPPFVLFGAGRKEVLNQPAVAIVGTRRPSPYGRSMAERLAEDLAGLGLVIVSGLARGIDSLAHEAALRSGLTVSILGSGLDKIYPPENRGLFKKIIAAGATISEYPPDEPPLAHHFPWRNRLISGLSLATIVVEASAQSGSLITARLALDQNREVMAVPGRAGSELSQGTNGLIKAGAKLIESWQDVVVELPSPVRDAILLKEKAERNRLTAAAQDEQERLVMSCLSTEEIRTLDEIVFRSGKSAAEILAILLRLELKGLVLSFPGSAYQRRV